MQPIYPVTQDECVLYIPTLACHNPAWNGLQTADRSSFYVRPIHLVTQDECVLYIHTLACYYPHIEASHMCGSYPAWNSLQTVDRSSFYPWPIHPVT